MDESNSTTTTTALDRPDEEILNFTISDEALEAAGAGTERGHTNFVMFSLKPCC
jgi:hypothetical protein